MAHDAVRPDYHLVTPSPWPRVASIAVTVMSAGLPTAPSIFAGSASSRPDLVVSFGHGTQLFSDSV